MITHPPFRVTDTALACYLGVPSHYAAISPRPIANYLPVRRLQEALQGPKLYRLVSYSFTVEQLPLLNWD